MKTVTFILAFGIILFGNALMNNGNAQQSILFDDCEDSDGLSLFGTEWFSFNDHESGGASTVEPLSKGTGDFYMSKNGASGSSFAARLEFELDQGGMEFSPFVLMGCNFNSSGWKMDLTATEGISFMYKGNASALQIELTTTSIDYDCHQVTVPASSDWEVHTFFWEDFSQLGWGTPYPFDLSKATLLKFLVTGNTGDSGEIWIDDIRLLSTSTLQEDKTYLFGLIESCNKLIEENTLNKDFLTELSVVLDSANIVAQSDSTDFITVNTSVKQIMSVFDKYGEKLPKQCIPSIDAFEQVNIGCKNAYGSIYYYIEDFSYEWSNGAESTFLEGLESGDYTVTISDMDACEWVNNHTISDNSQFSITIESVNPPDPFSSNGVIRIATIGGTEPFSYHWKKGKEDGYNYENTIDDLSAGIYLITVQDANGCYASEKVVLGDVLDYQPQICVVNPDTVPGHDLIIWDTVGQPFDIDYYSIYFIAMGEQSFVKNISREDAGCVSVERPVPDLIKSIYMITATNKSGNETPYSDHVLPISLSANNSSFAEGVLLDWHYGPQVLSNQYTVFKIVKTGEHKKITTVTDNWKYTDTSTAEDAVAYYITAEVENGCNYMAGENEDIPANIAVSNIVYVANMDSAGAKDKDALYALLQQVEDQMKDIRTEDYYYGALATYYNAHSNAQYAYENETATDSEIAEAYNGLKDAFVNLKENIIDPDAPTELKLVEGENSKSYQYQTYYYIVEEDNTELIVVRCDEYEGGDYFNLFVKQGYNIISESQGICSAKGVYQAGDSVLVDFGRFDYGEYSFTLIKRPAAKTVSEATQDNPKILTPGEFSAEQSGWYQFTLPEDGEVLLRLSDGVEGKVICATYSELPEASGNKYAHYISVGTLTQQATAIIGKKGQPLFFEIYNLHKNKFIFELQFRHLSDLPESGYSESKPFLLQLGENSLPPKCQFVSYTADFDGIVEFSSAYLTFRGDNEPRFLVWDELYTSEYIKVEKNKTYTARLGREALFGGNKLTLRRADDKYVQSPCDDYSEIEPGAVCKFNLTDTLVKVYKMHIEENGYAKFEMYNGGSSDRFSIVLNCDDASYAFSSDEGGRYDLSYNYQSRSFYVEAGTDIYAVLSAEEIESRSGYLTANFIASRNLQIETVAFGFDYNVIEVKPPVVDNEQKTITATVNSGTDLSNLYISSCHFKFAEVGYVSINKVLLDGMSLSDNSWFDFTEGKKLAIKTQGGENVTYEITIKTAPLHSEAELLAVSVEGQVGETVVEGNVFNIYYPANGDLYKVIDYSFSEGAEIVSGPYTLNDMIDYYADNTDSVVFMKVHIVSQDGNTTNHFAVQVHFIGGTETEQSTENDINYLQIFDLAYNYINIQNIVRDDENKTIMVQVSKGDVSAGAELKVFLSLSEKASVDGQYEEAIINATTTQSLEVAVVAEDGSVAEWSIYFDVVEYVESSENDLFEFTIDQQLVEPVVDRDNSIIVVYIPSGCDLRYLCPEFEVSHNATAYINDRLLISGEMYIDFSFPVDLVVVAEDGTEQVWAVSVIEAGDSCAGILSFAVLEQTAPAIINPEEQTIQIEIEPELNKSEMLVYFSIAEGAKMLQGQEVLISGKSFINLSNQTTELEIIAADGTVGIWSVSVREATPRPQLSYVSYAGENKVMVIWEELDNYKHYNVYAGGGSSYSLLTTTSVSDKNYILLDIPFNNEGLSFYVCAVEDDGIESRPSNALAVTDLNAVYSEGGGVDLYLYWTVFDERSIDWVDENSCTYIYKSSENADFVLFDSIPLTQYRWSDKTGTINDRYQVALKKKSPVVANSEIYLYSYSNIAIPALGEPTFTDAMLMEVIAPSTVTINQNSTGYKIYPVPFTSTVTFEPGFEGKYEMEIYSINGKLMFREKADGVLTITTDSFDDGIYIIRIVTENNVITKRAAKR